MTKLSPALLRLIEDLAKLDVQEYLESEAASRKASEPECSDPVPLPRFEQAA
jgi:hypothetical protein